MRKQKIISLVTTMCIVTASIMGCGVKSTKETAETNEMQESNTTSSNSDGSVEKGTEGTITVYTALEDDIIENYLTSFHEKYPDIEVNIVRDATGTIIAKAIAEKDNPVADVVWGTSASVLLQLDNHDLIQPYTPDGADRIENRFKD